MKNEMERKENDKKITKILCVCFIEAIFLFWCFWYPSSIDDSINLQIIAEYKYPHNDIKILGNWVLTDTESHLRLQNYENGGHIDYNDIDAFWLDCIFDEGIIFYSGNNKVGVVRLERSGGVLKNQILMENEDILMIDPAIVKAYDGNYYCCITEVQGRVNNSNSNMENGIYTIKLYKLDKSLSKMEFLADIASKQNNLEDVELIHGNRKLYAVFEEETIDKGDSKIVLYESDIEGGCKDWSYRKTLIYNKGDHEPANFIKEIDGSYTLYYSCDKNNPGQSYYGSEMFCARYDSEFNLVKSDISIFDSKKRIGLVLHDVKKVNGEKVYVYSLWNENDEKITFEVAKEIVK